MLRVDQKYIDERNQILLDADIHFDLSFMLGRTSGEVDNVMNELLDSAEEPHPYYFTFGVDSLIGDRYVKLWGTIDSTRNMMFQTFGDKWCSQLSEFDFIALQKRRGNRAYKELSI